MVDQEHQDLEKKIRLYNSIFSFTSMGGNVDKTINDGRGPYVFRINGQNHHKIGSLLPMDNQPKFAQLYIYDTEIELSNRMNVVRTNNNAELDEGIISELISMFDECNELTKAHRMARDRFKEINFQSVRLRLISSRQNDVECIICQHLLR